MTRFDRLSRHQARRHILLHSMRLHAHVVLIPFLHLSVPGHLLRRRNVVVDHRLLSGLQFRIFDLLDLRFFNIFSVVQNSRGRRLD